MDNVPVFYLIALDPEEDTIYHGELNMMGMKNGYLNNDEVNNFAPEDGTAVSVCIIENGKGRFIKYLGPDPTKTSDDRYAFFMFCTLARNPGMAMKFYEDIKASLTQDEPYRINIEPSRSH